MSYLPAASTRSTDSRSRAGMEVRVRGVIRVALRTVSLGKLVIATLAARLATCGVHLMRYGIEVGRIHARGVPTKMVQIHAWGYRSAKKLVRDAMSRNHTSAIPEVAIAQRGLRGVPFPAGGGLSTGELRPEALLQGLGRACELASSRIFQHAIIVTGVA